MELTNEKTNCVSIVDFNESDNSVLCRKHDGTLLTIYVDEDIIRKLSDYKKKNGGSLTEVLSYGVPKKKRNTKL